jgi:methyl-accepting chemotaxis protein
MDDDYDDVPASPIRRLEKRISQVEKTSSSEVNKLIEQIIDLIKSNQRIVADVVKSDAELRNEISKVPGKIDQLISSMNEFLDLLKASAAEETVAGISKDMMQPLTSKMEELVDYTKRSMEANQALLSSMGTIENRLKRVYTQRYSSLRR